MSSGSECCSGELMIEVYDARRRTMQVPSVVGRRASYTSIMSSPEQHSEPLDMVVAADGSGVVDAHQRAGRGGAPGARRSVVPVDTGTTDRCAPGATPR